MGGIKKILRIIQGVQNNARSDSEEDGSPRPTKAIQLRALYRALSARGPDNVICSQAWARFGLGASDGCEYLIKFKLLWSLRVVDHDHTTTYYRSKCHSDHVVCLRMYIDAIQKG
ncbi:hypothetical protein KIN20_014998 [Parelaphostrongylus tenuis]|uniref:Uncharacterized protein n=1 Tax=Parelaphostrongylus tenuis TaxID=148309 RepID=A0AAD5MZN6_PARTN|nr:hypothetical protein KIN20_014998 [Parelaphostrongylus tenuis]